MLTCYGMQDQNNAPIQPYTTPQEPGTSKRREILSTIVLIGVALLIPVLLTTFIFQSYVVDGPSMESTLQNNDRLLVDKAPRTWSRVTRHPYVPKRYDIIIFNHTGTFGMELTTEKQLIKRVVGLPGERVVVKDGIVTVYNSDHPNGFEVDRAGPESAVIGDTAGIIDQNVGQNEVYVMGDNRPNSLDSRSFGPVDTKDIVGKLSIRVYPFNKITRF